MTTERDPEGSLLNCTGFALRRASRAITQTYNAALAPAGLKSTQFSVLGVAASAGPLPMTRMADILAMDRTTLTRNLKPLERAGWIEVSPGRDQRERVVQATDAGRRTLEMATPLWRRAQREMHAALGDKTWQRLMADLDRVADAAAPP